MPGGGGIESVGPSPNVSYDPRVLYVDDGEGTFDWVVTGTGGDDVHENSSDHCLFGTKAIKLKTRVTSAAEDDSLAVERLLSRPKGDKLIMRVRFMVVDVSTCKYIIMGMIVHEGVRQLQAIVRYYPATPLVDAINTAGGYTGVTGLAIGISDLQWGLLEGAVDLGNFEWLWVRYAGVEVDLEGVGLYNVGASSARRSEFKLTIGASATAPAEVYFDSVYVGEREEL